MTEKDVSASEASASDLRGTLIRRLAVAGGLVAVLLGVLAFFDYLAAPPEEPESPVFTKPVPVAPKKEVSQPVTPNDNLPPPPEQKVVEEPRNTAEAPRQPAKAETAASPEAPTEGAARQPLPSAEPKAPRATLTQKSPPPSVATRPQPEISAPPVVAEPAPAPQAPRPTARVVEQHPAPAQVTPAPPMPPPSAPRLFAGFLLQAGVFSSVQRAEELHAKLTLSGVPSTLETRVQVGPFKTRQEAEVAQAKLKELGVQTILVPPKGGKP